MKKRSHRRLYSVLLFIFILLFVAVIIFIFIESGIITLRKDIPQPKEALLEDECSIMAGKIIHPLDREEDCQTKCLASCESKGYIFDYVEFTDNADSCNFCRCICR